MIAFSVALVLYLALAAMFFFEQRSLLYYPSHTWAPLEVAGANRALRELEVRTEDGINLKAWYAPATSKPYTIVFFHGNGDNLATAAQVADPYIAAGYGFLVAEYRGYSGLPGAPTEKGLYADGRAYMRALAGLGVKPERTVIFGHSLGTGVAVELASEFRVAGVMLLAPYLSIPKVAQRHFPIFPAGLLALDRFENAKKMGGIHAPVLIVNGLDDEVVPAKQGVELYALANEPKELHQFPHRGHNDMFEDFTPVSLGWLRENGK